MAAFLHVATRLAARSRANCDMCSKTDDATTLSDIGNFTATEVLLHVALRLVSDHRSALRYDNTMICVYLGMSQHEERLHSVLIFL